MRSSATAQHRIDVTTVGVCERHVPDRTVDILWLRYTELLAPLECTMFTYTVSPNRRAVGPAPIANWSRNGGIHAGAIAKQE